MTCCGCDLDLVLRQQELPNHEEALELLKELANAATLARLPPSGVTDDR